MKTITVTNKKENDTVIFLDRINYIREYKPNQVAINFGFENVIIAKVSLSDLTKQINEQ